MKLRIARKISWWGHPVYNRNAIRRAEQRIRKYKKNSPRSLMFSETMGLYQLTKALGASHPQVQEAWKHLRLHLCTSWNPQVWGDDPHDTYEWGVNVFHTKYNENTNDIITSNLSYYSDRWCYWRIAVMDCAFKQACPL